MLISFHSRNYCKLSSTRASLVAQTVKSLYAMRETWVRSPGQEDSLGRKWQPTPVLLPEKFHGWRSLVGYSPWVGEESDMTEQLHWFTAAAAATSLQSCPTLCDPREGSPPGSPVPGILQARTLEWVAISFYKAWKWSRSVVSDSLRPRGLQPTRLLHPLDFPGKSTGVGCHCLLRLVHWSLTKHKNCPWMSKA